MNIPDKSTEGARSDERIDIDRDEQAEHWARRFGVSADELRDAVRTVGDEVEKVQAFLAGGGNRVP